MSASPHASKVSNGFRAALLLILSLGWALFTLFSYFEKLGFDPRWLGFAFQFSLYPPSAFGSAWSVLAENFGVLLTVFLAVLTLGFWGRRFRIWLALEFSNNWLKFGFDFGLGAVLLNFFWLGLGLTRLWFLPLEMGAAFLFCAAALVDAFRFLRDFPWGKLSAESIEPSYFFLVLIGLGYWVFAVALGFSPENNYDAMVYHLAVPHYWQIHHGISVFSTNFFSNYPYGGELFYFNGMALQGTESAKMLHAVVYGFCGIFAGGWAWEWGSKNSRWLAAGLVWTLPLLSMNSWTTQVEGVLAFALLIALYFFQRWLTNTSQVREALLWGLMGGWAFSIKYTSALLAASAFLASLLIYFTAWRKASWKSGAAVFIGFSLIAGPWIVKNYFFTGNPFFPYFSDFFSGTHLSSENYHQLLMEQRGRVMEPGWDYLRLPWSLVMANPDAFSFCGPVVLAFAPFLFFARWNHKGFRFLAVSTLVFFILGLFVTHILRFLGTGFVLAYVLYAIAFTAGRKPLVGKIAAVLAGFAAILCFGVLSQIAAHYGNTAGLWSGRQTRTDFMVQRGQITPYYPMAQWLSAHLPEDKRLLIVGDARGLYYGQSFLTNTVFDDQTLVQLVRQEKDALGVSRRLKEMGVDYVVVNALEGIRVRDYHHYDLSKEDWKKIDDLFQRGTQLVYSQNFQAVYGLLPVFKKKPPDEIVDLVLFFSRPASQFMVDVQKKNWKEAGEDLDQTLVLYPFSRFWKKQKMDFDKAVGSHS